MIRLISKKTYRLSKEEIRSICLLKDTHWKFGLKFQLSFFKKNIKSFDIHNILALNNKIIGYTLLRSRKMKTDLIKKYLLFDTLVIKKNHRNRKLSRLLMAFNNKIIKNNRKIAFLMCNNNLVKFYKKNNWKKINKKNFRVVDHKFKGNGMIFNAKRKYPHIDFYTR